MHAAWFGEMNQMLMILTDIFKALSAFLHCNELAKNIVVPNEGDK